jgi:protein-tyrosine phosphatase
MTMHDIPARDARLDGAPNFRSVGALPAAGGRRTRPGRLWRSDALHRLTDADLEQLAALRIASVLDLRRDDERGQMPSRWPSEVPRETLTFDALPDLQVIQAGGWRSQIDDPSFDAAQAHRWMLEIYTRMPGALAPAVREGARRLAAGEPAEPAILVHCTAGKDRTGFVVAMLLSALGVPRDAIVDDYLESARRRPPDALAHALFALAGLQPTERTFGAVRTIADVRVEFLDAALESVAREHGSIDAYLARCGLDGAMRDALAATLLD